MSLEQNVGLADPVVATNMEAEDNGDFLDSSITFRQQIRSTTLLSPMQEQRLGARIFAGQASLRALQLLSNMHLINTGQQETVDNLLKKTKAQRLLARVTTILKNGGKSMVGKQDKDSLNPSEEEDPLDEIDLEEAETTAGGDTKKPDTRTPIFQAYDIYISESVPAQFRDMGQFVQNRINMATRGLLAYDEFVHSNLRLLLKPARKMATTGEFSQEDFIDWGVEGLMNAVERFDFRRKLKFSTIATPWIRQVMNVAKQNHAGAIRIPTHIQDGRSKGSTSREGQTLQMAAQAKIVVSLNTPIGEDGDSPELQDLITYPHPENPEEVFLLGEKAAWERELLAKLPQALAMVADPQDREILNRRFGTGGVETKFLKDIAAELGVSRVTVLAHERKALAELKKHLLALITHVM